MSDRRLLNCESACAIPPSRQHPARCLSPWRFYEAARLRRRTDVSPPPPPPGVASFVRLNNAQTQDQKNAFAIPTREAHVRVRAQRLDAFCFCLRGPKNEVLAAFDRFPSRPEEGEAQIWRFFFGALQPSPSPHRRNCTALLRAGLDWTYCTSGFVQQRHGDGCIEIRLHECIALGLALPSQSWSSLGETRQAWGSRVGEFHATATEIQPPRSTRLGGQRNGWMAGWTVGGWTVDGFLVRRDKLDTDCSADRYFHLLHRLCQK